MEKVMIYATPEDIAKGLKLFLSEYKTPVTTSFVEDKLDIKKAAKFSSVSYATFLKWIISGKIRVYGQGRNRFILKSELIEDLKNLR